MYKTRYEFAFTRRLANTIAHSIAGAASVRGGFSVGVPRERDRERKREVKRTHSAEGKDGDPWPRRGKGRGSLAVAVRACSTVRPRR